MLLTARNPSSLVMDNLCDQAREDDIPVTCLYCDFLAQQEQTTTNMIGAILRQLVGRGDIPIYLREAFQEGKKEIGGREPLLADLMGILKIVIASLPQVFICIDALDECLPKHLQELLKSLRELVRDFPRTRIFFTGRPPVKEDIQRYFPKLVVIPISPNTEDIRNYIKMGLEGDTDPQAMSDDLRVDVMKIILDTISDMYVGALPALLPMIYAYQRLCADSFSFPSTWTLFWERRQFVREDGNYKRWHKAKG